MYERTAEMPPGDPRDGSEHVFDGLPRGPGRYLATAWLEGRDRNPEHGFSTTDVEYDCVQFGVVVEQRGTPEPTVAVTAGRAECPDETARS